MARRRLGPPLDDRLGVDEHEAIGASLETAFPALDDGDVRNLGERVLDGGDPETTELRVDDEEWLELRAVPAGQGLV